jgi:hypothetical protein
MLTSKARAKPGGALWRPGLAGWERQDLCLESRAGRRFGRGNCLEWKQMTISRADREA